MLKLWLTSDAGLKLSSPAWLAVIWHEPAPVMWTVSASAIEQLPLAPKDTSRLELALALTSKSASP